MVSWMAGESIIQQKCLKYHKRLENYGAKKEFVDRYDLQEFLRANHLTDEQIVEDITALIR